MQNENLERWCRLMVYILLASNDVCPFKSINNAIKIILIVSITNLYIYSKELQYLRKVLARRPCI